MKRSNSWKHLQKTFASTPILPTKRPKFTRQKVAKPKIAKCPNETIDLQIEDSDEENEPVNVTPIRIVTPFQQHNSVVRRRRFAKPLLINTSLNSTISSSFRCDSDNESNESVSDEPELKDVSEFKVAERSFKVRSKSLRFLSKSTKNQPNSNDNQNTDCNTSEELPSQRITCSTVNTRANSQRRDQSVRRDAETTIESDSSNDIDSPKKSTPISATQRKTFSADILFTQSDQNTNSLNIESQNSVFSLKFESPTMPLQRTRSKSRKHVKGGLVERLNKLLGNQKSEYSYWMNERTSDLIEPGEKLRIDKIEPSYGRILLYCSNVKHSNSTVEILCIDPAFKKLSMLQIGGIIEVCFDDCDGYAISKNSYFYPQVSKILV